jgi:hypothetical protein
MALVCEISMEAYCRPNDVIRLLVIHLPIECHLVWRILHSFSRITLHLQRSSLHLTCDWPDIAKVAKRPICSWCVRSVWRPIVDPMRLSDLWISMPPIECHLIWHYMHSSSRFTLHMQRTSFHSTWDWPDIASIAKRPICPWCVRSVYRPTVDPVTSSDLWLFILSLDCNLIWQYMHS